MQEWVAVIVTGAGLVLGAALVAALRVHLGRFRRALTAARSGLGWRRAGAAQGGERPATAR